MSFGVALALGPFFCAAAQAQDAQTPRTREDIRWILEEHVDRELARMQVQVPDDARRRLSEVVERGANVVHDTGGTQELIDTAQENLTQFLSEVVSAGA